MSRPLKYAIWTTHEIARLKRDYPDMPRRELASAFAPHSLLSVESMALALGLKKRNRWVAICAQHKPVIFAGAQT